MRKPKKGDVVTVSYPEILGNRLTGRRVIKTVTVSRVLKNLPDGIEVFKSGGNFYAVSNIISFENEEG